MAVLSAARPGPILWINFGVAGYADCITCGPINKSELGYTDGIEISNGTEGSGGRVH